MTPSDSNWPIPVASEEQKNDFIDYIAQIKEAKYQLTIFRNKDGSLKKIEDSLVLICNALKHQEKRRAQQKLGDDLAPDEPIPVTITVTGRTGKAPKIEINTEESLFPSKTQFMKKYPPLFDHFFITKEKDKPPLSKLLSLTGISNDLMRMSCNDINPKSVKQRAALKGIDHFDEDGSNIALLLRNLLNDKKRKEEFHEYLNHLMPNICEIKTEDMSDKTVLIKIKENYFKNKYFSSPFLSDGTANIIAMIYAIYYNGKNIKIIEEPEKNLHPQLMGSVMEMMKDAAESSQLIITTHNPILLRNIDTCDIIIVKRDASGNSTLCRFKERDDLDRFLIEEIGIGEMMIQGKLGD